MYISKIQKMYEKRVSEFNSKLLCGILNNHMEQRCLPVV